jgi:hypothetical protein
MAQGVGSLTFDNQHEQLRRKMLRSKPDESNALTHLYGGLKGFGVGVFGGLTGWKGKAAGTIFMHFFTHSSHCQEHDDGHQAGRAHPGRSARSHNGQ